MWPGAAGGAGLPCWGGWELGRCRGGRAADAKVAAPGTGRHGRRAGSYAPPGSRGPARLQPADEAGGAAVRKPEVGSSLPMHHAGTVPPPAEQVVRSDAGDGRRSRSECINEIWNDTFTIISILINRHNLSPPIDFD